MDHLAAFTEPSFRMGVGDFRWSSSFAWVRQRSGCSQNETIGQMVQLLHFLSMIHISAPEPPGPPPLRSLVP
nr:hypothetical protein Iba_chr10bCG2320 [Ipomoea batatas]GMD47923.1 hypothetical protein Iba_chr10fCG1460 [Ipomoea batatas]